MSIFFNAVYKLRVQLFGGGKGEQEAVDVPVNRKRKLADDTSGFNKRAKLEMENIDAEEGVTIIPGESWADKTWSLVRNMFSPSREPRKTNVSARGVCVSPCRVPRKTKIRRVRKEDLNRDSRFINQIHSSDTIQKTSPSSSNIQEVVDVEDNSSQGSSNDSGESSRSVSTLGNFEFSNSNFKPGPSSIVKRFHVLTKREKELRAERNKPANLTAALKSGTKTKRSTYSKIFGKHRPRASSGVNTCINMEARKNYENLLMRNTSAYLPSVLGRDRTFSSLFAPNKEQRSTFFTPSSIDLERLVYGLFLQGWIHYI
ncbi:uncharacterized protein LOC111696183 [Eurytemora carolleeae]|uniref:uncharacterized protein LOC111696183 n=1 Tax=Eurytemora carolleeae TaxID=1294199 RepID=UPI000C7592D6|nr:uncharacterized protein LOC111696183 [Eurytemora carolleeae]|eukprot:XP_023321502.1 uncharacterized protein LOC111696183 [Eurytemora affinis]